MLEVPASDLRVLACTALEEGAAERLRLLDVVGTETLT